MTSALLPSDEHDEALRRLVAPPDWVNPEPAPRYNLVVVGGGTAGLVCAAGAAGLGARVALVERDLLGGDCLNVGCVPSKALLAAARAVAQVRSAGERGVTAGEPAVDFPAVMARLRRLRAELAPNDSAERFRGLGVDVFRGQGVFTGPETLSVRRPDGPESSQATLRFAKAVIATGARAAVPAVPGLAEAWYFTNETIFTLTALPRRLAVLGGGPIGCELAQAFARLGSAVTLIERGSRLLRRDEADAAALVAAALRGDGVTLTFGATLDRVEGGPGGQILHLAAGSPVEVDAILIGAGRKPNVDGLGLEAAGVGLDSSGRIAVDDGLRTANRRIYAAGDVCSAFQFTHAADAMARLVLRNALFWGRGKVSRLLIPWCTYTDPELAQVGLTEEEARSRGVRVDLLTVPFDRVDRAVLDGEDEGFVKVLLQRGTDRVVGATAVGAGAGEVMGTLVAGLTPGLHLGPLAGAIFPYPTRAEVVRKLADAYNRTRLTPGVKGLLGWWLAWQR